MDYSGDGIDCLKCLWEGGRKKKQQQKNKDDVRWSRVRARIYVLFPSKFPQARKRPLVCKTGGVEGSGLF